MNQVPGIQSSAQHVKKPGLAHSEEKLRNCLHYTRKIRDVVHQASPFSTINGDAVKRSFVVGKLEEQAAVLTSFYDTLEQLARELPDELDPKKDDHSSVPLDVFYRFVNEASQDKQTAQTFQQALNEVHYAEYSRIYSQAAADSISRMCNRLKSAQSMDTGEADSGRKINGQKRFKEVLKESIAEHREKSKPKLSINYIFHEESLVHAIVELRIVLSIKEQTKLLLLVNHGNVDYINIYGVAESWQYLDHDKQTIDVYAPSAFEVYRGLTKTVNTQFQNFLQSAGRKSQNHDEYKIQVMFLFTYLLRLLTSANDPCCICGKRIVFGIPPTVLDARSKTISHASCR